MASWRIAPSLGRLRAEVNTRFPRRDKRSDGDLGDVRHLSRSSDHNPYNGYVHAWDVDKDGVDIWAIVRAAIAHPSTNYVIWNRTIWSRAYGFRARRYTGSNPHTMHAHISVMRNSTGRFNTRRWLGATATPKPAAPGPTRTLRLTTPYMRGADVLHAQYKLNLWRLSQRQPRIGQDSVYGPGTRSAMVDFQRRKGLAADGVCGPRTWDALRRVGT